MKTKILFACLAFCYAWQANAQTDFAPIGAEWYYTYTSGCCPEEHFNQIISEKDTIVEGNSCRLLRQYYDNSNVANEKYIIKQEQGKVYYYYQDKFHLLFDFDVEVNDIVEFTFMYEKLDYENWTSKDTILSARYIVEDITINAQNLKTFRTKVLEEDAHKIYVFYPYYPNVHTYTEKIGLHSEFMPMFDNAAHPDEEIYRWLRCYSDADIFFISKHWEAMSLPCDYTISTGINIWENEESIRVYPNPINDNVFVFANNGGNIEIIDAFGKIVYCSDLLNGINEISTGHFLKGIYFIKIKNNRFQIFKIIKS